jgi:hypothetical protein
MDFGSEFPLESFEDVNAGFLILGLWQIISMYVDSTRRAQLVVLTFLQGASPSSRRAFGYPGFGWHRMERRRLA